jgi:hypothetical protein
MVHKLQFMFLDLCKTNIEKGHVSLIFDFIIMVVKNLMLIKKTFSK